MPSYKTWVIEEIFKQRYDSATGQLSDPVVTLTDVSKGIEAYNRYPSTAALVSTRNVANFFKDIIRVTTSANRIWPATVFQAGFTARQLTGSNNCFEFVPIQPGQLQPFVAIPGPSTSTPTNKIESASLPLASRRLGRADESWLIQVVVRLHIIETHLAVFSPLKIMQVDHLQIGVKQARSEIDALFLALEETESSQLEELIVCVEAKGSRDDLLVDQILAQVDAVFAMSVTQNRVIPMGVKTVGLSKIHVIEFQAFDRSNARVATNLSPLSEALYELVPPVPGIR